MAVHINIETPTEKISATAWALGSSPDNPIPVERRPSSYRDALRKYRVAKQREASLVNARVSVEEDISIEPFYALIEADSPDIAALAQKLKIAQEEFGGSFMHDVFDMIVEDAMRLGGQA